jgi:hypothetical protein
MTLGEESQNNQPTRKWGPGNWSLWMHYVPQSAWYLLLDFSMLPLPLLAIPVSKESL